MSFRFYTNLISQASRNFVSWLFMAGLALIGFGILVYLLRDLFAVLAAAVFVFAGLGCVTTAAKIFFTREKTDKFNSDDSQCYRKNVRIHTEDYYDL